MISNNTNLSIVFLLFSFFTISYGQHPNVITLDSDETGNQQHLAKQRVKLLSGYSYSSTNNSRMHAEVDPGLPGDIVTQSLFSVVDMERSIDNSQQPPSKKVAWEAPKGP